MREVFSEVRRRSGKSGMKSTDRYNLRRRYEEYQPGQRVWKKNYVQSDATRCFNRKLAPKYVGPYIDHKKVLPWTYLLQDTESKVLDISWHIKDLKSTSELEPGEKAMRATILSDLNITVRVCFLGLLGSSEL
ncbi:hypothetical protein JTB14_002137 [Gonioctena quinquepunctata]|nr:hypothetical protein JTB14_002137 [Gonioctena quinquepunctata]